MPRLVLICLLALALLVGCTAEEPVVVEESTAFFVIATPSHPSHDYILCIPAITENPECLSKMISDGG